jgi:formiminotetrahydrofolate cyclodeaminase
MVASETMSQPSLFDLPATELLAKFGAGTATPGSGCAAALMALLSTKLVTAVARMTEERGSSQEAREQAAIVVRVLETRIGPRLKELFDEDAFVFEQVIVARKQRDNSADPAEKRKFTAQASDNLHKATEILFEIVELSFQVKEYGSSIWEKGFRPAMGDAGAGISAAIAAITTCLLVANLNLRSTRSNWAREARSRWEDISVRLLAAQEQLVVLVKNSSEDTAGKLFEMGNLTAVDTIQI